MRLTVERDALLAATRVSRAIIDRKNIIPILANVHLGAMDGDLCLTATNLDMQYLNTVAAEVIERGVVTVPGEPLHQFLHRAPAGAQVEIALDGTTCTLKAGRARFELPTLPPGDFPMMSVRGEGAKVAIDPEALARVLSVPQFAAGRGDSRQYLNGIYLHASPAETLRGVATNGHLLCYQDVALPEGGKALPGVIVSLRTCQALQTLLDGASEARLTTTEEAIIVEAGEAQLTSKVINGQYPDYARTIPIKAGAERHLSASALQAAVDLVSSAGDGGDQMVSLSFEGGELRVHARSTNKSATASQSIDCTSEDAGAFTIAFRASYLLEICKCLRGGDDLVLTTNGAGEVSRFSAPERDDLLIVAMPIRI
ncbi:MAG: DNA polymerase III subunit beta [Pseudomonadota bacterium]